MRTLGEQVRAFREERGWNTAELAKRVGTSRQNIESLEARGNRIPKYLGTLAAVMERRLESMLSEAGLAPGGESLALHDPGAARRLPGEERGDFESPNRFLPGFEALSVPVLAAAASMGAGEEQHDDVVVGRLTLSPQWISKTLKPLTKPENLRFIHGYGDSMEPTFYDGDVLLVDGGVRECKVDGIYVLSANERLYIKRVRQRIDGSYEISSDNPTVKTVDILDGSRPVEVLGRIVWAWNGKKL